MGTTLDHASYPHIIDRIMELGAPEMPFTWRATCRKYRARIGVEHVRLEPRGNDAGRTVVTVRLNACGWVVGTWVPCMYDRSRRLPRGCELSRDDDSSSDSEYTDEDERPIRDCRQASRWRRRHTTTGAAARFLAMARSVDVSGGESLFGCKDREGGGCIMRALERVRTLRAHGNACGLFDVSRRSSATKLIVNTWVYPAPGPDSAVSTIPSGVEQCTANIWYSFAPSRWLPRNTSDPASPLRASVYPMGIPFSLRRMTFIFTRLDAHSPDYGDLRRHLLLEPPSEDGDLPLGWLRYLAMALVRVCHRVKFTFVGLLDLDPTLLGFAEPMTRGELKDAVVAALRQQLDEHFELFQGWWPHIMTAMFDSIRHATYEDRWRGIENVEFLTHDEYRARTDSEEYALETSRPGWPTPLSTNLDKPETKEDDNASCDPLVGDAA